MLKSTKIIFFLMMTPFLYACGGGGSENSKESQKVDPPPVVVDDPTVTISQISTECFTNEECNVIDITASKVVSSFTFNVSSVSNATLFVNGTTINISSDSAIDVSSYNSDTFQLIVHHDTAENLLFSIKDFTVDSKIYSVDKSVNVEFTDKVIVGTGHVELAISMMGITKVNTNSPLQVVKGETPSTFYLSDLKQTIKKYNEETDLYEAYLEQEITLTNNKIEYDLPEGKYFIYLSGNRNMAGRNITFKSSLATDISIGGWSSNHINMYPSGLSDEDIEKMHDYDSQFSNGDTKDFTLLDLMTGNTDENGVIQYNLGSMINYHSYDVLSSTNNTVTIRYYLTVYVPSIFYGINFTSNSAARVEFKFPDTNNPIIYDTTAGQTLDIATSGEIPIGENTIDITISNVAYSGNDLEYTIKGKGPFEIWATDLSGFGGTSGIGSHIKTIKVKD